MRGGFDLEQGTKITTIGAAGCSQRASYQVLCGPSQEYGPIESSHQALCDVIPSSGASRVVNQNNQEQQRLNEAAAAAQQKK